MRVIVAIQNVFIDIIDVYTSTKCIQIIFNMTKDDDNRVQGSRK